MKPVAPTTPFSSASVKRKMTSLRKGRPASAVATTARSASSVVAEHVPQSLAPDEVATES